MTNKNRFSYKYIIQTITDSPQNYNMHNKHAISIEKCVVQTVSVRQIGGGESHSFIQLSRVAFNDTLHYIDSTSRSTKILILVYVELLR